MWTALARVSATCPRGVDSALLNLTVGAGPSRAENIYGLPVTRGSDARARATDTDDEEEQKHT